MARPNLTAPNGIRHSVQNIWNWGFDDDFGLPMVEALVYNSDTDQMERMTQPGATTTPNSSLAITYNGSNQPIYINKTTDGVTKRKTLTWVGSVCTAVSVWVTL